MSHDESGLLVQEARAPGPRTSRSLDGEVLASRLADLARTLQHERGPGDVMARTVVEAVAMVPGAEAGSITLVHRRRQVTSVAASGPLPRALDRLQEETGQGPCLDAAFERATVRVEDLPQDPRWPVLAASARGAGIGSVLCLQLFVSGDGLGALNLVSSRRGAFTDESEHVGLLVASHAAVAVADAQRLSGLAAALAHRDVIGQAKGILMERFKVTSDEAFRMLTTVSQETNHKLHEVAEQLAASGSLRP